MYFSLGHTDLDLTGYFSLKTAFYPSCPFILTAASLLFSFLPVFFKEKKS